MSQEIKVWHITNMPSEAGSDFVSKRSYDQALAAKDAQIALLEKKLEKCKEQRDLRIRAGHARELTNIWVKECDNELDSITVEKGEGR